MESNLSRLSLQASMYGHRGTLGLLTQQKLITTVTNLFE